MKKTYKSPDTLIKEHLEEKTKAIRERTKLIDPMDWFKLVSIAIFVIVFSYAFNTLSVWAIFNFIVVPVLGYFGLVVQTITFGIAFAIAFILLFIREQIYHK